MLVYCVLRSIGIEEFDGDYRCLEEKTVYVTSDIYQICDECDISDKSKIEELKIGDLFRLEGMNRKMKTLQYFEKNDIVVEYYIMKKNIKIDE